MLLASFIEQTNWTVDLPVLWKYRNQCSIFPCSLDNGIMESEGKAVRIENIFWYGESSWYFGCNLSFALHVTEGIDQRRPSAGQSFLAPKTGSQRLQKLLPFIKFSKGQPDKAKVLYPTGSSQQNTLRLTNRRKKADCTAGVIFSVPDEITGKCRKYNPSCTVSLSPPI